MNGLTKVVLWLLLIGLWIPIVGPCYISNEMLRRGLLPRRCYRYPRPGDRCMTKDYCTFTCQLNGEWTISGQGCYLKKITTTTPRPVVTTPDPARRQFGCGVQSIRPRLSSNTNYARKHSWPWQALIWVSGRTQCGGAIIDEFHVTTAAHCLDDCSRREKCVHVYVGAHDQYQTQYLSEYLVRTVHVHAKYRPTDNDIAVLRLERPIDFNYKVQPICLPQPDSLVPVGTQCVVAGWGVNESLLLRYVCIDGQYPGPLQQQNIEIANDTECSSMTRSTFNPATMLCGNVFGSGQICHGDSGSPLMCNEGYNWVIHGIVSFGNEQAGTGDYRRCKDRPVAYTNLTRYTKWIKSLIG